MEFAIGLFVGALLFWLFVDRKKVSGEFIIDCSDPLNDEFCTLRLYDHIDTIWNKKTITVKVRTISQK
jgi:hypothetical protein